MMNAVFSASLDAVQCVPSAIGIPCATAIVRRQRQRCGYARCGPATSTLVSCCTSVRLLDAIRRGESRVATCDARETHRRGLTIEQYRGAWGSSIREIMRSRAGESTGRSCPLPIARRLQLEQLGVAAALREQLARACPTASICRRRAPGCGRPCARSRSGARSAPRSCRCESSLKRWNTSNSERASSAAVGSSRISTCASRM